MVLSITLNVLLALIGIVDLSGTTFGDRCSVHYGTSTREWQECVDGLAEGRPMRFPSQGVRP